MLKFILTNQEDFDKLSKEHQGLYEEDGAGRWVLQVEGAVPKKQLDDFRATNIDQRKKLEAYGDITADEAKELKAKKAEFDAGNDPKKIEELVEKRVNDMKATHATDLNTLKEENARLKQKQAQTIIDAALIEAGTKAGLRAGAQADLIARGRNVFSIADDGETIQAVDSQGNPVYGGNGDKLSPASWIAGLAKEAAHLFETSNGGGSASQGKGTPTNGKVNPWMPETWNLTEQGRIVKEDRNRATSLAAAAGRTL